MQALKNGVVVGGSKKAPTNWLRKEQAGTS
jgi:hypothetical protein